MEQTYCIYKLTNQINQKSYIGFTKNFHKRIIDHNRTANKGTGQAIHAAIRKYGWGNFVAEELYYSYDKQHTLDMEDQFINLYQTKGQYGYNITRGGQQGPPVGTKRLPLTEQQLIAHRERFKNSEIRRKISEGLKGNKNKLGWKAPVETRDKQSAASKGRAGRTSDLYSPEEVKKRSDAMKGNRHALGMSHTKEWKQNMSVFMKKRDHSYKIGRKQTAEQKQKISESMKKYRANIRKENDNA